MHVCTVVCMCMCTVCVCDICIYMCVYVRAHLFICVCVYLTARVYMCVLRVRGINMCMFMSICECVFVYVYSMHRVYVHVCELLPYIIHPYPEWITLRVGRPVAFEPFRNEYTHSCNDCTDLVGLSSLAPEHRIYSDVRVGLRC